MSENPYEICTDVIKPLNCIAANKLCDHKFLNPGIDTEGGGGGGGGGVIFPHPFLEIKIKNKKSLESLYMWA